METESVTGRVVSPALQVFGLEVGHEQISLVIYTNADAIIDNFHGHVGYVWIVLLILHRQLNFNCV